MPACPVSAPMPQLDWTINILIFTPKFPSIFWHTKDHMMTDYWNMGKANNNFQHSVEQIPLNILQFQKVWKTKHCTFFNSFWLSFPVGGKVVTVKLLGSSQSRILDSFIKESSLFFAMFSTCFLLVEAYRYGDTGVKAQKVIRIKIEPRAVITK